MHVSSMTSVSNECFEISFCNHFSIKGKTFKPWYRFQLRVKYSFMYLAFQKDWFTFGSAGPKWRQYPVHFWNEVAIHFMLYYIFNAKSKWYLLLKFFCYLFAPVSFFTLLLFLVTAQFLSNLLGHLMDDSLYSSVKLFATLNEEKGLSYFQ